MDSTQPQPIKSPRFSKELKQLWETLKTTRHNLEALDSLDILFLPEKQLAFVAHRNNPVNRFSVASVDHAVTAYWAQRQTSDPFQLPLRHLQ